MRKTVGRQRRPRRIQETLDVHGILLIDIARGLGVTPTLVSSTVKGRNNNRRVLRRFLELGVRPEDLDLPPDLRAENKRDVA